MLRALEWKVACNEGCSRILEARLSQFERRPGDQRGGQRKDALVRLQGASRCRFVARSPQGSSSSSKGQAPYGGGAGFAPGPGLGESFLTWDGSQYLAHGSEAGILILLPRTSVKSVCCIIFFLVSDTWEWSVCSGIGVPNIYEFLSDEENILKRPEIAQLFESAKDHTNRASSFRSAASKRIVPGDG